MDAPAKSALPDPAARTETRAAVRREHASPFQIANSKTPVAGEVPSPKAGVNPLALPPKLRQLDWVERLHWQAEIFGYSPWRTTR